MSTERVTYAKIGGPPDDWQQLTIVDLDTGRHLDNVIEIDTANGWAIVYPKDEAGRFLERDGRWITEMITGRFEIRRDPPCDLSS